MKDQQILNHRVQDKLGDLAVKNIYREEKYRQF